MQILWRVCAWKMFLWGRKEEKLSCHASSHHRSRHFVLWRYLLSLLNSFVDRESTTTTTSTTMNNNTARFICSFHHRWANNRPSTTPSGRAHFHFHFIFITVFPSTEDQNILAVMTMCWSALHRDTQMVFDCWLTVEVLYQSRRSSSSSSSSSSSVATEEILDIANLLALNVEWINN